MSEKIIALTFDDGPNTTTSLEVLDLLERHHVKASFFLIGQQITEETIPVIQRELELGCEINNHSWQHLHMDQLTEDEIREEIDKTTAKIEEVTGKKPVFFRPPYIDVNDLMYEVIDMPFICGQASDDWVSEVSAKERIDSVLNQAVDGAIVLLHDFEGNDHTVEALNTIIPELQKQGFTFVTVGELFERKGELVQKSRGKIYSVL